MFAPLNDSVRSMPRRARQVQAVPPVLVLLALVTLFTASASAQPPTVNGLFYGDGDHLRYVEFATSFYGSKLYVFYDPPTTTLYVAFVVDPSINENVFGQPPDGMSGNYMSSTGWGAGGGQQRGANALVDSEFAQFTFACAPGSAREWTWNQGYACQPGGPGTPWVSDTTCGTSQGPFPPSLLSASSFAWNLNTYEAAAVKAWDRDLVGATSNLWVSPFDLSVTGGVYTPVGLDGYPALSTTGDPDCTNPPTADGTTVLFSTVHQWEWRMVYEWSINLGPGGANCADQELFLISGLSHHSPAKDEATAACESTAPANCGEENDCFPDAEGAVDEPFSDYGDLPDSYSTLRASNGAQHTVKVQAPFLGLSPPDIELDGAPSAGGDGDDSGNDDEDGVTPVVTNAWNPGTMQTLEVVVGGTGGSETERVAAWLDWNNDGDFLDTGECQTPFAPATGDGTYMRTASIPSGTGDDFDPAADDLHLRYRIVSSEAEAPGGSLGCDDFAGVAGDGEVEDYVFAAGTLLPLVVTGQIGDFVWRDDDGDAVQDAGEPGIAGVTLELQDGVCTPSVDCPTQVTDGSGAYLFTGLPTGNYTVDVISGVPAGFVLTTANDPLVVTLGDGESFLEADFGYQPRGTLTKHVFEDTNGNGVQDVGEPDLQGVTVNVTDSQGVLQSAATNATGDVSFDVAAGVATCDVDETTLPPGLTLTTGNDPHSPNVPAGGTVGADVGYQPEGPPPPPPAAQDIPALSQWGLLLMLVLLAAAATWMLRRRAA